jgi:hypothetical protein
MTYMCARRKCHRDSSAATRLSSRLPIPRTPRTPVTPLLQTYFSRPLSHLPPNSPPCPSSFFASPSYNQVESGHVYSHPAKIGFDIFNDLLIFIASEKQIAANRRNALRSTGPKTPHGKAIVSRNCLIHALTVRRRLLLEGEDQRDLDQLFETLKAELQPLDRVVRTVREYTMPQGCTLG